MMCLAFPLVTAGTAVVSASADSLTVDFDNDADFSTDTSSSFYWQTTGTNRVVPKPVTEDGLKQGKFEGPSTGTNYHNLVIKDTSLDSTNYVVEMKVKRTTQDSFAVYVQGSDTNNAKIANFKIKGAYSSIIYQSKDSTYKDLSASRGVGAYDTIYLHVDTSSKKCQVYVNSSANCYEYDYDGDGKISNIRFDMQNDITTDGEGAAYVDYIKIYPAGASFLPPILNLEFENEASKELRNKATWSTAKTIPDVVDANGLKAVKMDKGNSNYLLNINSTNLPVTSEVVVETKVKISSASQFNICYTVTGDKTGTFNLRAPFNTSNVKTFYDATKASLISGAYYETDVIPTAPNFNIGWNTIYVKINPATGAYTAYVNGSSTSGNVTNSVTNAKFTSLRFDCNASDSCAYVDSIRIYDAAGWTAPSNAVKYDIDDNFEGYETGASAYNGLINYANDTAFSVVVSADPTNSSNKCLEISGTAEKTFDIGINSTNAVIEYKAYLPQNSYCQIANIQNTENKGYVASYTSTDKTQVNFSSTFGTMDGKTYAKVSEGWNTFKYIINTADTNEYTLYTFVNGRFINKEKYTGTVKYLRMSIPKTEGVKLYIDDFSVKYNSGFNITLPEVYKDGTKLSAEGNVANGSNIDVKYTALNIGDESVTKNIVFAVYKNENGALSLAQAEIIGGDDTAYAKGFNDKSHTVTLKTAVDFDNGDIVKVFCWNDASSLTPFTEAVVIEK